MVHSAKFSGDLSISLSGTKTAVGSQAPYTAGIFLASSDDSGFPPNSTLAPLVYGEGIHSVILGRLKVPQHKHRCIPLVYSNNRVVEGYAILRFPTLHFDKKSHTLNPRINRSARLTTGRVRISIAIKVQDESFNKKRDQSISSPAPSQTATQS